MEGLELAASRAEIRWARGVSTVSNRLSELRADTQAMTRVSLYDAVPFRKTAPSMTFGRDFRMS
jgi:hypothetical protein